MDTSADWEYIDFAKLICYFIGQWKEKLYLEEDFERIEKTIEDEKTKDQFRFAKEIFHYYEQVLKEENCIDFSDMINYAYRDLDEIRRKCNYLNYKYIIIDEYQDISFSRYQLVKKISDIFQSKIVAVGDDWQSIFEFSGSDLELFTSFQNSLGYGEIITITNTYRNSQELIDTAGEFISKNTLQFQKKLQSFKHLQKPIEIVYYTTEDVTHKIEVLKQVILNITQQNEKSKILLLGRFNKDIEEFIGSTFRHGADDRIIFNQRENANITFLTVHKSKGLGFDQVILINSLNSSNGFPSKIKDKPLIALLKENKNEQQIIEYPEERRLFYVALTRTKNKIYILDPYHIQKVSSFVKEIQKNYHVLENKQYMEEII